MSDLTLLLAEEAVVGLTVIGTGLLLVVRSTQVAASWAVGCAWLAEHSHRPTVPVWLTRAARVAARWLLASVRVVQVWALAVRWPAHGEHRGRRAEVAS